MKMTAACNRWLVHHFAVVTCALSGFALHYQPGDNMELNSGQIKRLRAEGHRLKLKPVVIIGQKGLTENLHHEIDGALDHHELIKLRIPALDKPGKREISQLICEQHQAYLVESIGSIIVIYRLNKEVNRYAAVVK
jgi:RNA-binding protein